MSKTTFSNLKTRRNKISEFIEFFKINFLIANVYGKHSTANITPDNIRDGFISNSYCCSYGATFPALTSGIMRILELSVNG